MINLIPAKAKKAVLTEYWVRVVSVWVIIWSIVTFVCASILLPVYVLIGSQISALEVSASEASQKVSGYENVSATLVDASQHAKFALDEFSRPVFSDYITLFEEIQGSSIQLNNISLLRNAEGIEPILLVGVALDREALASFRDRLLAEEVITSVDLPISNLARDKDIPFTITVTLNQNLII